VSLEASVTPPRGPALEASTPLLERLSRASLGQLCLETLGAEAAAALFQEEEEAVDGGELASVEAGTSGIEWPVLAAIRGLQASRTGEESLGASFVDQKCLEARDDYDSGRATL